MIVCEPRAKESVHLCVSSCCPPTLESLSLNGALLLKVVHTPDVCVREHGPQVNDNT